MKLAVICILTLAYLATVHGRIFTRNDLQSTYRKMPANRASQNQVRASLNAGRQRPIFARRGQYERQRVHVPSKTKTPVHPTFAKPLPKPINPRCSQLTQSCLPKEGCCDARASCHCHFFNAICFCRKTSPHHGLGYTHYGQTWKAQNTYSKMCRYNTHLTKECLWPPQLTAPWMGQTIISRYTSGQGSCFNKIQATEILITDNELEGKAKRIWMEVS